MWRDSVMFGALLISTSFHAVPVGKAARTLIDMIEFVNEAQLTVHEFVWATYDVQVEETPPKPEEKPQEKEPEKDPDPAPIMQPQAKVVPVDKANTPPAAAEAGKTLTAPDDPYADDSKADFTMVQGKGDAYVGGVTAADGKAKDAVYDRNARGDGAPGGTGSGPATQAPPPPPPGPDQSRPAKPSIASWSCPFPAEADQEGIDHMTVQITVKVGADGTAKGINVMNDPGHGFGRSARQCALTQRYTPALDRDGNPTVGTTPVITVRFTR